MQLRPGEVECKKCKGTGVTNPHAKKGMALMGYKCLNCDGSGKLDWIENVTGKKFNSHDMFDHFDWYP